MAKPEIQFVGPVIDRRPRKPRNGYGKWGFLVTLLSCGLLSPLGLLLSLRGLFGRPKGLAFAGTILGGLGTAMMFGPLAISVAEHAHRRHMHRQHEMRLRDEQDRVAVSQTIANAQQKVAEFYAAHGALPEGVAGNKLIVDFVDRWEQPLRYETPLDMTSATYTIRSAGRDQKFETRDDIKADFTAASRNEAATPTAAPAAEAAPAAQPAPTESALRRIEFIDRRGRTYVVVVNR